MSETAFPYVYTGLNGNLHVSEGISIRDYFAAKAMQGLIASDRLITTETLAQYAYEYADAMLEARQE